MKEKMSVTVKEYQVAVQMELLMVQRKEKLLVELMDNHLVANLVNALGLTVAERKVNLMAAEMVKSLVDLMEYLKEDLKV
jgi:hypothetical protein